MNTNEISGKRQMEFLAEFDYIREAGTVGEEKAVPHPHYSFYKMFYVTPLIIAKLL